MVNKLKQLNMGFEEYKAKKIGERTPNMFWVKQHDRQQHKIFWSFNIAEENKATQRQTLAGHDCQ